MSNIFERMGCAGLPTAVAGDGVYVTDADGKRYLDGCGGAAVSCLGHSPAAVTAAVAQQVSTMAYAHSGFFTSAPAEQLARELAALAPGNINRVYPVCGGSEAVEAALKLARQFHIARGESQRRYIIGRWQSYHGNTLGALAVGGNRARRGQFAPLLFDGAHHIDPCHYWRWGRADESAADYGARMATQLEEKIKQLGEDSVAAFIAETVVGATMGAVPAVAGYFKRIREICDRYGVLLILDEVMCGVGRTGYFFAGEAEGVVPDMVCIAKGLGAGVQPLGAMLCDERIYAAVTKQHGGFQHGHTYIGHATACAAGVAVLAQIQQQQLLTRVRTQGARLEKQLRARLAAHPHIGDIRGRGLFWGVEFVAEGKEPFAPAQCIHRKIKKSAMARGLMVYAMGGSVDGERGDHILLAPPYIISDAQIDELTDKLADAVADVF